MGTNRVTIKDIAKKAGVTHSTVSRALNDSPRVKQETKEFIKQLAADMGFQFNAAGRSLSTGTRGIIAVIHDGEWDGFGTSQYFNLLFASLRKTLVSFALDALVLEARNPETGESSIQRLIMQNKVDGFILVHSKIPQEDYRYLTEHGVPFVQLHSRPKYVPAGGFPSFFTDNITGGRIATEHLIACGCRRVIDLVGYKRPAGEFADRLQGYREALAAHGLPYDEGLILFTDCSFQSGYRRIMEQKELFRAGDGIFCQADVVAFGAITALKELGWKVGEEIQVVGFDDTPICGLPTPSITSVHQPVDELSRKACRQLHGMIHGTGDTDTIQEELHPWLVERGSTSNDMRVR